MKKFSLLLVLVSIPTVAGAVDHIPMWGDAGNHCYTLEGAKQLLVVDKAYSTCLADLGDYELTVKSLSEVMSAKDATITSYESELEYSEQYIATLEEQLAAKIKETNQWRMEAEKKHPLPWVLASIAAATAVGFGISTAVLASRVN